MVYGTCEGSHIESVTNSFFCALSDYEINGSAMSHFHSYHGGIIEASNINIYLNGNPEFSAYFLGIATNGIIQSLNTNFIGAATGRRFIIHYNGVLRMNDSVKPNTSIPGSIDGIVSRGGVVNLDK